VLRLREFGANFLLIIAGVLMAAIVAELAIRACGLAKPAFYAYDGRRGWGMRPGAAGWQRDEGRAWVRINRWGYRGADWSTTKPPDTLRIAVIGDSFTEAPQVAEDQTFTAVAARTLEAISRTKDAHPMRVEGLNLGVDGYGTAQELLTLPDVWKFAPDVIVLAFFPGNDFRNNSVDLEGDKCRPFYVYRDDKLELGGPFVADRRFRFSCFARFASEHSQLLNVLGRARSVIRAYLRRWANPARPKLSRREARRPARPREPGINDAIYVPPFNPVWRAAWRVTEAEIEMAHQEAERHHTAFLLMVLSVGIQVSPDSAERSAFLKQIGATDLFYPDQRLRQFGAAHGFDVLDLPPAMQAYAVAHRVYFHGFANTHMGVGHWNQQGHEFGGRALAAEIERLITRSGNGAPTPTSVP
jgi:hypothetical protein